MNKVKVTIIIETDRGTETTTRESSASVMGAPRALVLPPLFSAIKAAAADHLSEIDLIRGEARRLADALGPTP